MGWFIHVFQFFSTTLMLGVCFSLGLDCVEADCWNRSPPPCSARNAVAVVIAVVVVYYYYYCRLSSYLVQAYCLEADSHYSKAD